MRKSLMFVAVALAALWAVPHRSAAAFDQVIVLTAVGMRQALVELAPIFERATGHSLVLAFDSGAMIVRRVEAGEAADVVCFLMMRRSS